MTEGSIVEINGRWNLWLPEHRAARPEWTTGWERERLDHMSENIKPGMVVYDIGAEEGDISALCAKWADGVCLFEPNERVWPNIRAIWEANDLPPPLATFAGFAASETSRNFEMQHPWPDSAYGPVIGDHGFCHLAERDDIPKIRLDDFAELNATWPNAITIDVEGAEWHVLRGAESILRDKRPLVWVSVHPQFMQDIYSETSEDLFRWMAERGYSYELLAVDHEEHYFFWPDH